MTACVVAVRLGDHLDAGEVGQRQLPALDQLGEAEHVDACGPVSSSGVAAERGQAGRLEPDHRDAGLDVRRAAWPPCAP